MQKLYGQGSFQQDKAGRTIQWMKISDPKETMASR